MSLFERSPPDPAPSEDGARYVEVALKLPLRTAFPYRLPPSLEAQVGNRVRVPFRRRDLPGVVVAVHDTTDVPLNEAGGPDIPFATGELTPPLGLDVNGFVVFALYNRTEELAPGAMSLTRRVPFGVPSVAQSSVPLFGSVARKNTRLPQAVNPRGSLGTPLIES